MRLRVTLDNTTTGPPTSWRLGAWSSLLALFGVQRGAVGDGPDGKAYTLTCDPASGTAWVTFHDAIRRRSVLELADRLRDLGDQACAVRLDVSAVRRLDARGLATLALLCTAAEHGGGIEDVRVCGLPAQLRRRAIAAGIQHLVPLELPPEGSEGPEGSRTWSGRQVGATWGPRPAPPLPAGPEGRRSDVAA